jgi:eukaryotic-like serine/threonine-protein kinase
MHEAAAWSRVEEICDAALSRRAHERDAFLTRACADDHVLRREVESLLAQEATADQFLSASALEMVAHTVVTESRRSLVGQRVGPYEISGLIGAGGMGEVYRARDTKLGRDVAIKILPPVFATDPERLARFEREARLLAALNHPHIGAIYGLEAIDGAPALVLELVDGDTLAERLVKGPLSVADTLAIARQIAEALEAAHERGIVHRDLKPANIKITPAGIVKVLDFGLAKATAGDASTPDLSPSSTITVGGAREGVALGTAAYMSPEQASGKLVDKRADIWAFGTVVFEMLTGRRAFAGDNISITLASVMVKEPDWGALLASTPVGLRRLLTRCLKKDATARMRDIGEARLQIEDLRSGAPEEIGGSPAAPSRLPWLVAAACAVATVVAVGALGVVWRRPLLSPPVTHLQMSVLPADQLVASIASVRPSRTAMALSPNGRLVVFSATRGTVTQLYLRGLDHVDATPVPGTEGAIGPFFSPDGGWIGFWADNKIKKVQVAGGPPVTICDAAGGPGFFGASWGEDGTIFFGTLAGGISRVSSAGGTAAAVTTPDASKGERHQLPHALPGGRALMFTARTSTEWETANVVLQSLDTGEQRVVIEGGADARYVSTGHLVYMKTGTLMAVPFDVRSLHVTGAPVALIEGVMQAVNAPSGYDETGAGQFTLSNSGTLLYVLGGVSPSLESSLARADRNGAAQPLAAAPVRPYLSPRLSPDGQKVAVFVSRGATRDTDVWVYDVLRGAPTRLTFSGANQFPIWSPDGKRLVYASNTTGVSNLYATNADGSGKPERLTTSNYTQVPSSWAATGNVIAFVELHSPLWQIWVLPLDGDRKLRLFLDSRFTLTYPEFSPDGHWMAYVSNESGANEVYVQPYPGPGEKTRVSTNGGREPIWTANSRELLYRAATRDDSQRFFSAAIRSLPPFRADPPRLLFEAKAGEYSYTAPVRDWDVSADGQRFFLRRPVESTDNPVTVMHVVVNWSEELRRLAVMSQTWAERGRVMSH